MKVPISWLKDFVDVNLPIEELAHRMTLAGLEVEEIRYIGLEKPGGKQQYKISGFSWEPDKIVVGAIHEVMPHPNAAGPRRARPGCPPTARDIGSAGVGAGR